MILLYNPQSSSTRQPALPQSLLAVGAVLEGHYEYQIVDGNLEADPLGRLDALVRDTDPLALGFTVMPGPQLKQAVPLARELKRRHPRLPIVWGGYFPSQHWDVCLRSEYVDYVVQSHGEYSFKHLLDALATADLEAQLPEIAGLAYRNGHGEPVTNPRAPIPHPAELPDFNFDRVPVERYITRSYLGGRTLPCHTSYSCPFFCNFCAVVNLVNGAWLAQPAERVARTVRLYTQRWGINGVAFHDNNFFVQQARTAEFAERILDLEIGWWGEARIDTLLQYRPRSWQLMRDSGLRMVFMGAESGSMETLKQMDKGGTMHPDKTLEMARVMPEWNIIPEFSFVMGNPPDPEGDIRQTMEFIRNIKRINPHAEIIMYLYTPVPPAGDLYENAKAAGFAFPETLEEWVSERWVAFSQRRSETMPWIQRTLRSRLREFERVLNAYYPTATDMKLTRTWKTLLRALPAWRYHLRCYRFPVELEAMQRFIAYQRPETTGF